MAGYQFDYDAINQLSSELLAMNESLKGNIREVAYKIGNDLKNNTAQSIPRGARAKHGTHLADDVRLSVSVNDKRATITVKGGSKTGGYWWLVDNGHIAKNGKFVDGAHFTDKAYAMTDVKSPVDAMISEVLKNE